MSTAPGVEPVCSRLGHDESFRQLRRQELSTVLLHLEGCGVPLKVGGCSGYQAALLAQQGNLVVSVDFPDRDQWNAEWPVIVYDGRRLPVREQAVDVVFSSHVLERVRDQAGLLEEIRRVLRPGGLAIHIAPSLPWRIWTCLAHYPFLLKWLFGFRRLRGVAGPPTVAILVARRGILGALTR